MANISIQYGAVAQNLDSLIATIQDEIIDASAKSSELIIAAAENSSGDFIEALKEEVNQEAAVIKETGELLIAMAQYVQSATNSFAGVNRNYNALAGAFGETMKKMHSEAFKIVTQDK